MIKGKVEEGEKEMGSEKGRELVEGLRINKEVSIRRKIRALGCLAEESFLFVSRVNTAGR